MKQTSYLKGRMEAADAALDAARKAKDRKATWICLGRVAELKDMLALASESQRKAGESADETPERQEENADGVAFGRERQSVEAKNSTTT